MLPGDLLLRTSSLVTRRRELRHILASGRTVTSDLPLFALATLVYQAGRLIINLLAAAALGPIAFGTWSLMLALIIYLHAASLGVTNGAGREIPYLHGLKAAARARAIQDVALGSSLAGGCIAALAGVPLLVWTAGADWALAALFAGAVFLQHPFLLQQVVLRSSFSFAAASIQLMVLGTATVGLGIPLLQFGIHGLVASQVLVYALALLMGVWLLPVRPRPRIDPKLAIALAAIGLPIMVAGLLYGLLTTVDRWIVLWAFGPIALGQYGLVGLAVSGLLLLPGLLSQQFYPRMSFAYGSGKPASDLFHMAQVQGVAAGVLTAIVGSATVIVGWLAIPMLLPDYLPALGPLSIASVGAVAYAGGSGYGNFLNTVGAHRRFLIVQAIALGIGVAMALISALIGLGLNGVALGTGCGFASYSIMAWMAARSSSRAIYASNTRGG